MPLLPKKFLGIDIGSSAIKVVELSGFGGKIKLENFGEVPSEAIFKEPFRTFDKSVFHLSVESIAKGLDVLLEEAQIKTKSVFFSIPDFVTFFTTFELPPMTKKEIPLAVNAEARRHIPVPLSEVIFDWQVFDSLEAEKEKKLKILLVAVPLEIVTKYRRIAQEVGLKLISLESEVFSLARIFGEAGKTVLSVDIGAQTTTCSIIENKILKRSFSLDLGGVSLSERIAKSLEVGFEEGERLKREFGIEERGGKIRDILIPQINIIFNEIERIIREYEGTEKKKVEKIIFSGGEVNLPGFEDYANLQLKREMEIGNPFKNIVYPPVLQQTIEEIGPSFSIAVGVAMRGFEQTKWK